MLATMFTPVLGQIAAGGGVPAANVQQLQGDIIVTITQVNAAGVTQYIKSTYVPPNNQATRTVAGSVPRGSIGLGTITGSIGVVKTVNWNAACTDAAKYWKGGMAAGALAAFII